MMRATFRACATLWLLGMGGVSLAAESYSLTEFLDGFVEDFDGMGPLGAKAPGPTEDTTYWDVFAAGDAEETAFTLVPADGWPSNVAYNMGYNPEGVGSGDPPAPSSCTPPDPPDPGWTEPPGCEGVVDEPTDRALGIYCGSTGDARWLETTILNDTGAPFTGSLLISYDVEFWIQRTDGNTAGFTLIVDGAPIPASTTYRENVIEPRWSLNHWIDGNTVKDAVSVEVPVNLAADGILTLRWDGVQGIPGANRRRLGCGIDNLAIAGVSAPAPTIESITPSSGPLAGGTEVTVTGTNLTAAAAVTIGGNPLESVTVTVPDTVTGLTPAGDAAGAVDVVLTDAGGSATLTGGFTYEGDAGPVFRRGDCNDDGTADLSDAVCTLNWLFLGAATPGCVAVTNTNGDDKADLSDAVYLLSHLFLGGPAPAEPYPDCGVGTLPADEEMGCETPPTSCP